MKQISKFFSKIQNFDWRYRISKGTGYSFPTEDTSGKTLEFIGTSGIGKTTLYRGSVNKLRHRWFFNYHLDLFDRKLPPSDADESLMRILKMRIEKIYDSDSFNPWHSLLDIHLSVRVMYETLLVTGMRHPKGFAFDEGLFRHFPAEILQLGDEFPAQHWENRAFVYLRARTPETALSRRRSREMSPASQKEGQRTLTDDQHLSSIVQDQEMFQSIVDKAPSFGCPVLVIDAEDPIQDSIKKVLDFESSLSDRFKMQEKTEAKPQTPAVN